MKKKINKTVEVCDFCEKEGWLQTCVVCRRKYCILHKAVIIGDVFSQQICKGCENREDIKKIIKKYFPFYRKYELKQLEELKQLPKKEAKDEFKIKS
jgi:hypothetical protein